MQTAPHRQGAPPKSTPARQSSSAFASCPSPTVVSQPSCFDLLHLPREVARGQDPLLEEDVGEGRDPALVVGQLTDHLGAERLDPATLLFGVDDLVKVEDVCERVTTLLPRLELMVDARDGFSRQAADVVGQALEKLFGPVHGLIPPASVVTGTTPIIASRVTRAASSSSV